MIYLFSPLGLPITGQAFKFEMALPIAIGAANVGSSIVSAASANNVAEKNVEAQRETNESNIQAVRETNIANQAMVDATNQANYELWKEQNNEQWKMWSAQNDYNSPVQQMQRFKQAGLNPALAMMNGANSGMASAMTAPTPSPNAAARYDAPQSIAPHMDSVDYGIIGQAAASSLSGYSDYLMKSRQAEKQAIDNKYADLDWRMKLHMYGAQIEEQLARKDLTIAQRTKLQQEKIYMDTVWNDLVKSQQLNNQQTEAAIKVAQEQALNIAVQRDLSAFQLEASKLKLPLELGQLQAGLKQIYSTIALQASQRDLNASQIDKLAFDCVKTWFEAEGIKDANSRARELQPWIVGQYKANIEQLGTQSDVNRTNATSMKFGPFQFSGYGTGRAAKKYHRSDYSEYYQDGVSRW